MRVACLRRAVVGPIFYADRSMGLGRPGAAIWKGVRELFGWLRLENIARSLSSFPLGFRPPEPCCNHLPDLTRPRPPPRHLLPEWAMMKTVPGEPAAARPHPSSPRSSQ